MAGRRSSYNPDIHPRLVVDEMKQGKSKMQLAAMMNITRQTFYNWENKHKEFAEAVELGLVHAQAYWEKICHDAARNDTGNPTMIIFNMKNRFYEDWKDRVDNTHSAPGGGPVETVLKFVKPPENS